MALIGLHRGFWEAVRVLRDMWDLRLISIVVDRLLRRVVALAVRSRRMWGSVLMALTWSSMPVSLVAGMGVFGSEMVGSVAIARCGGLRWVPGGRRR